MNYFTLPLEEWTNDFVYDWLIPVMGGFFEAVSGIISFFINGVADIFVWVPAEVMAIILILLAWKFAGKGVAIFTLIGVFYLGSVDLWEDAMLTLAVVIVATLFSIVLGVPLGILSAKSEALNKVVRPVLDFMQTLPSFVYLIPAILLFGLGEVPAVISTFVFATPPAVRMTSQIGRASCRERVSTSV